MLQSKLSENDIVNKANYICNKIEVMNDERILDQPNIITHHNLHLIVAEYCLIYLEMAL